MPLGLGKASSKGCAEERAGPIGLFAGLPPTLLVGAFCVWVPRAMTHTLPTNTSPDKATLLKEVRYRLSYRGTLELDFICRAALPHLESMDEGTLTGLRDFLLYKEGDLMKWLVDGVAPPAEVEASVKQLKRWFAESVKA